MRRPTSFARRKDRGLVLAGHDRLHPPMNLSAKDGQRGAADAEEGGLLGGDWFNVDGVGHRGGPQATLKLQPPFELSVGK